MKSILRNVAVLCFALFLMPARAEEKNGLLVNVSRRTLERSNQRDTALYTRFDRTQGVKMVVKNTSLRQFAEGEVVWTLVVRRPYVGTMDRYSGTEKLKPLRSSETAEMMIGSVPVSTARYDRTYKDEIEYDISVVHAGKETIRLTSTSNFAMLAKRATPAAVEEEEEDTNTRRRKRGGAEDPTMTPDGTKPAVPGVADANRPMPPGAAPATPMVPATPMPAPPANPADPIAPPSPAPAPAAVDPAKPADLPPPLPENSQPFDFFNLKNKKPAGAQ